MAITTIPPFFLPAWVAGSSPGFTAYTLNATGDKIGCILMAPKTGNIHKIGFRTGTVTTPTNTDVRVETVSARVPSGTLFGTNTNGTIASGSLTANTFVYATLTADAAVTRGQVIAIAIVPSGSPNYNVSSISTVGYFGQLPYTADGTTGTWTPSQSDGFVAIEYDDGSYAYAPGVEPYSTLNTVTFNSSSNPEIVGLKFKLPVPYRVAGYWIDIDLDNSVDIVLYDSDGTTALATASLTNAARASTNAVSPFLGFFSSSITLTKDTFYYLAVKPGASNVSVYNAAVASAAVLDQFDGGQNFHYATFHTNTWTPVTASRPFWGLMVDGIDDGVSTTAAQLVNSKALVA